MADGGGPIAPGPSLDIEQLQREAKHRWLRPVEICEILRNFLSFQIMTEVPTKPTSGSLLLFDRKVLRYFRKDGHNWRKKRDGKTVKEAHEKLKVGSVDVLHCYYAHGEENENFQRRSYWLLEKDYEHIVFVHYLEVKANKGSSRDTEAVRSNSWMSNSSSSSVSNHSEPHPANAGSPSVTSTLTSGYEDFEYEDNNQTVTEFTPFYYFPSMINGSASTNLGSMLVSSELYPTSSDNDKGSQSGVPGFDYTSVGQGECPRDSPAAGSRMLDMPWEQVFQQATRDPSAGVSHPLSLSTFPSGYGIVQEDSGKLNQHFGDQVPEYSESECPPLETKILRTLQFEHMGAQYQTGMFAGGGSFAPKQPLLVSIQATEDLQKVDSFSKWASKELGDDDLSLNSTPNISWCNIESGNADDVPSFRKGIQLDDFTMSPSISQDQLFSIVDISPGWTYIDHETEVFITGRFLKSLQEVAKCHWSCMFGEVEVPADVVKDGVLRCYAPPLHVGHVPFYITRSNRLACSEVREFEYRPESSHLVFNQNAGTASSLSGINEGAFHMRLEKLLSSRAAEDLYNELDMKHETVSKIASLLEREQHYDVLEVASFSGSSASLLLKEKLLCWLVGKVSEDGKGPNILDKEGQGLLHLAAALGYDWIIRTALEAGAIINFRDVNGWTALHWAAFCGREKTVALLVSLGAASGALTDPSPEFPLGRTPADLASTNGHKGISGFLAESSLTTHLAALAMNDQSAQREAGSSLKAVQTISEKTAAPDYEHDPPLLDSLAAVRNATQAADRIHQVFRMQSFQREHFINHDPDWRLEEEILSFVSPKMQKRGQYDEHAHSAAVEIQKNFRKYKRRKEFVTLRQTVVKLQARVRGHQVRKRYKTVLWSVGILEKVVLRWRRKGTGLRGFRPDGQNKIPSAQGMPSEDDYDFLREGRQQTEKRLEKALVRVKSMVQYPEARDQYRRLLTTVEEIKNKPQATRSRLSNEAIGASNEEDMIDVETLLGDTLLVSDAFMAFAFDEPRDMPNDFP